MTSAQTLIENEQVLVDDYHLRNIEKAVRQRIEGLEGFGRIDGRENMNKNAEKLKLRLEAWLLGVHDKVPADFQEIKKKGY